MYLERVAAAAIGDSLPVTENRLHENTHLACRHAPERSAGPTGTNGFSSVLTIPLLF
jgi:hypothetical protein